MISGEVTYYYSPSAKETEAGALLVPDQPGLHHDKLSREGEREAGSEHEQRRNQFREGINKKEQDLPFL